MKLIFVFVTRLVPQISTIIQKRGRFTFRNYTNEPVFVIVRFSFVHQFFQQLNKVFFFL